MEYRASKRIDTETTRTVKPLSAFNEIPVAFGLAFRTLKLLAIAIVENRLYALFVCVVFFAEHFDCVVFGHIMVVLLVNTSILFL